MGTHGLPPVAANLDPPVLALLQARVRVVHVQRLARFAGEGRAVVLRIGVDAVIAGQLQRPAIVVVLPGEEEGVGETVAFRRVVAVVLVGGDGVQAEAHVRRRVDRQGVVVAHHDRLAVTGHQQLRWHGAVEGPYRLVVLDRHVRVEAHADAPGGAADLERRDLAVAVELVGVVVQPAGREFAAGIAVQLVVVARAVVDPGAGLHGLELALREELVVALVRPALPRRPALGRGVHGALEVVADLRGPGVGIAVVGVFGGRRVQPRMAEEGIQFGAQRAAARYHRVEFRPAARHGLRESAGERLGVGFVGFRAELLEPQHRLAERLGAEQRARPAIGGNLEGGLRVLRNGVLLQRRLAVAFEAVGQFEGAVVAVLRAGQQVRQRVARRVVVVRRVVGGRIAEVVQRGGRGGDGKAQQEQCAGNHVGCAEFRTGPALRAVCARG
ncbi:hypothetical protein D9M68_215050 [compost metagenome]